MSTIFNAAGGASFANGQCHVTVGAHQIRQDAPVTVRDLRRNVKMLYPNLDSASVCYLGSRELSEDDTVNPGDNVNFSRKFGEKGLA